MSSINNPLSHKLFISAFLKTPCVLETEAQSLYQKCIIADNNTMEVDSNQSNLDSFVSECNRSLDMFDMAIMRVSHPNRDSHYYILTNYKHDDSAKLATSHKPGILETYKNIVNLILHSSCGSISSTSILNSITTPSISKAWFEKTILPEWESDFWLEEIDRGVYTLGIRALYELKDYLRGEFENAKRCQVCEEVALMPITCTCSNSFFHRTCLVTHATRTDVICSKCGNKLSSPSY